jgi:hypothetical protein
MKTALDVARRRLIISKDTEVVRKLLAEARVAEKHGYV